MEADGLKTNNMHINNLFKKYLGSPRHIPIKATEKPILDFNNRKET